MKYLLDTNTVIYFFKGIGRVAENLLATSPRDIAIPAVVLYELDVGVNKSKASVKRRKQLQALVEMVHVVPFGQQEALSAAQIRSLLEKQGVAMGLLDNLIAGTALANNCTLVTHNSKELDRVKGLNSVDWYSSVSFP